MPFVVEEEEERLDISRISFAYDNIEMINQLKKRGSVLTAGTMDKLAPIDDDIKNIAIYKYDTVTRPVTAFITFETQEGFERASTYWGRGADARAYDLVNPVDKNFLGDSLVFDEA